MFFAPYTMLIVILHTRERFFSLFSKRIPAGRNRPACWPVVLKKWKKAASVCAIALSAWVKEVKNHYFIFFHIFWWINVIDFKKSWMLIKLWFRPRWAINASPPPEVKNKINKSKKKLKVMKKSLKWCNL